MRITKSTRLRKERIKKGWTQNYVADYCDVSPQTVCDWEKGRHRPSYDALDKLEELFCMNRPQLLEQMSDDD